MLHFYKIILNLSLSFSFAAVSLSCFRKISFVSSLPRNRNPVCYRDYERGMDAPVGRPYIFPAVSEGNRPPYARIFSSA
jgi:hypothetical protein